MERPRWWSILQAIGQVSGAMANFNRFGTGIVSALVALGLPVQPVLAQKAKTGLPESILHEAQPSAPAPVPSSADASNGSEPVVQPLFVSEQVMISEEHTSELPA